MNIDLSRIIRESINDLIYDDIISEAIDNVVLLAENDKYDPKRKKNRGFKRKNKNITNTNSQETPQNDVTTSQQQDQNPTVQNQQQGQQTIQQLLEKYNFKQYSDQLRRLIGNGIDPKPVADDQNSVQFINAFNQFLYTVITAIENNNITRIPSFNGGKGGYGTYQNPYDESPFRTAIQAPGNIIGAAADAAEGAVSAVPGLNQLYGGVFGAFNKGRNEQERLNNQIRSNYIQYQNAKNGSEGIGNAANVQGSSLSELMLGNNSQYASMNAYYQNANGTNNGKLDSIAVIPQCFEVLRQLYNALAQYQQEMQKLAQQAQQNQQGQQGQNTENGGDQEQINEDKPRPDYAKYESDIENDRQKLEKQQVNIGKISDDASVCADGMIKLMASVVSAINNNIYYTEDDKNGNSSSLTALMSLNGNDNPENITINAINEIYSNLINSYDKEDSVYGVIESSLGKPLTLLNKFRKQMKTDGVVENGGATSARTSAPENSGSDGEIGGETTNTEQMNNTNGSLENESNEQEMKFNSRINELNKMYKFDKYGNSSISEGSALFREYGDELREKGEQEKAKHNLNISIGLQTMNNVALSMIRNGRNADEKMLNNWYENLIYADKMFSKSNNILNEKSKQNYIETYNYLSNFYKEIEKGEYK